MQQSSCLVVDPKTINIFASIFDCTPVNRASNGPNIKLVEIFKLIGARCSLVCCLVIRGSGVFLLLRYFSGVVSHRRSLLVSQNVVPADSSSLTHHRPYSGFVCFLC